MSSRPVTITCATIHTDQTKKITASKLRGYLGHLFAQDSGFHHHDDNPYRYPLVQYKKIDGHLVVMGVNDYSQTVFEKLSALEEIVLPNSRVTVHSVEMSTLTHRITDEITRYEFKTPWMALNSINYAKFKETDPDLRYRFLENILIGNFLSAAGGMGARIDHKLYACINELRAVYTMAHGNPFLSFRARFVTNLALPEMVGIGNSVSKGFGVVART